MKPDYRLDTIRPRWAVKNVYVGDVFSLTTVSATTQKGVDIILTRRLKEIDFLRVFFSVPKEEIYPILNLQQTENTNTEEVRSYLVLAFDLFRDRVLAFFPKEWIITPARKTITKSDLEHFLDYFLAYIESQITMEKYAQMQGVSTKRISDTLRKRNIIYPYIASQWDTFRDCLIDVTNNKWLSK